MGVLADMRLIYELGDCQDHEVIDRVLDAISEEVKIDEDRFILNPGRELHRITLSTATPTSVVSAELNIQLDRVVSLSRYNLLDSGDYESPGSWFVRKGFTVRSTKENGYWVQYAFMTSGATNLTRSEVMEYLEIAELAYSSNTIGDFGPTVVSRSTE